MKQPFWKLLCLLAFLASSIIPSRAQAPVVMIPQTAISVAAADGEASEAGSAGLFVFYRTGGETNLPVQVIYEVTGTAHPGVDYHQLSGVLLIAGGQTRAYLRVEPIDDNVAELDETVAITVMAPGIKPLALEHNSTGVDALLGSYIVGAPSTAKVVIRDDDTGFVRLPTVTIRAAQEHGSETGNKPASFLFNRTSDSSQALRVDFGISSEGVTQPGTIGGPIRLIPAAINGVDYATIPNTLTFPAGKAEVSLEIVPKDDALREGQESITLQLKQASAYNLNPPSNLATVFIEDNDTQSEIASVNVSPVPAQIAEADGKGAFVFTRTGNMDYLLEVRFTLSGTALNGVDYKEVPSKVIINARENTAKLEILPIPDKALEGSENIILTLNTPECGRLEPLPPNCFVIGVSNKATMVISEGIVQPTRPIVRILSPEDGARLAAPATLAIRAEASDPDGVIERFDLYLGDKLLGSEKQGVFSLSYPGVAAGQYVLLAVATDNSGLVSTSAPVRLVVASSSLEAHVNFQPAGTRIPEGYLPDNGQSFGDRENALNYGWKISNGERMVNRNAPNSPDQRYDTFAIMQPLENYWEIGVPNGRYKVHLVAGDPRTTSGFYDIRAEGIRVVGGSATPDKPWVEGTETITVSDGRLTISNGGDAKTNRLCFIDITGEATSNNNPPFVSIAQPANGASFPAGSDIVIVAKAEDTDGFVRKVEFLAGNQVIGVTINDPAAANPAYPFQIVWKNVARGNYALSARATDDRGAVSTSQAIPIVVTDGVIRPQVFITKPLSGQTFPAGSNIEAGVIASDPKGYMSSATLYDNGRLVATHSINYLVPPPDGTQAEFTFILSNLVAGTHVLVAEGKSSRGISGESSPTTITVTGGNPGNGPQVEIRKPLNGARVGGARVDFTVYAVDPAGYILEGALYRDNQLVAHEGRVYIVAPKPGTPAEFNFSLTNVPAGTYTFIGEAKNDRGITGRSAPIQLTVTNTTQTSPPTVFITSPLNETGIVSGTQVPLVATAEGKQDAAINKVVFLADGKVLGTGTKMPDRPNSYRYPWDASGAGPLKLTAVATDSRGLMSTSAPVMIHILQVDAQNVVNVEAVPAEVLEGGFTSIRFSRTGSTASPVSVAFEIGGSAIYGVDYLRLTNMVTIGSGQSSIEIKLATIADNIAEGEETVVLTLIAPVCPPIFPPPPSCYSVGRNGQAKIVIADKANPAPVPANVEIVSPANGTTVNPGNIPVRVLARDPDGYVPTVELMTNGVVAARQTITFIVAPPPGQSQTFDLVWSHATPGIVRLTARAIDSTSLISTSAPVQVTVRGNEPPIIVPTNAPPKVILASPVGSIQVMVPTNITLRAEATDPDGTIAKVEFLAGNTLIAALERPPFVVIWTNREPGTYSLSARATDNKGATALSSPVIVQSRVSGFTSFVRNLPDAYRAGTFLQVTLTANTNTLTKSAFAVEDMPPAGWTVSQISANGRFDPITGRVKFGPFTVSTPLLLSYSVRPPEKETGPESFTGYSAVGDDVLPIGGDSVISDTAAHPADRDESMRMTLGEVVAYNTAWKNNQPWGFGPTPIPQSYVTRANFLWSQGEFYALDARLPAPAWWIPSTNNRVNATSVSQATASMRIDPAGPAYVGISVNPGATVSAYTVEESIPVGVSVSGISEGGVFHPALGVIRWGPFLDHVSRSLQYTLSSAAARVSGSASFDGLDQPIVGRGGNLEGISTPALRSVTAIGAGMFRVLLSAPPGKYQIEASSDLVSWENLGTFLFETTEFSLADAASGARYYRLRPAP